MGAQIRGGYQVLDANGQSLAYVYGRETKADADIANVLTMDEARRIASNIAKLPTLLGNAGSVKVRAGDEEEQSHRRTGMCPAGYWTHSLVHNMNGETFVQ